MVQNDHFLINLPRLEEDEMGPKMIKNENFSKILKNFRNSQEASGKYFKAIFKLKNVQMSNLMLNLLMENFQKFCKKIIILLKK